MSRPKREATVAEKRRHSTKITGRPPTQSAARPRGRATAKTGDGRSPSGKSPSQLITDRIAELGDWRGEVLSRVRKLIREADPEIVEEWKWRGVPVWSHNGIVCTGESYTQIIKLTFAKGASLKDPKSLFNSSLDGNVRRAIDIREGEKINEPALKGLVRDAVALNVSKKK